MNSYDPRDRRTTPGPSLSIYTHVTELSPGTFREYVNILNHIPLLLFFWECLIYSFRWASYFSFSTCVIIDMALRAKGPISLRLVLARASLWKRLSTNYAQFGLQLWRKAVIYTSLLYPLLYLGCGQRSFHRMKKAFIFPFYFYFFALLFLYLLFSVSIEKKGFNFYLWWVVERISTLLHQWREILTRWITKNNLGKWC